MCWSVTVSNRPGLSILVFRNLMQCGLQQARKKSPFWLNSTGKDQSAINFNAHFRCTQCEYNTNTNLEDLNLLHFRVDKTHSSCQPHCSAWDRAGHYSHLQKPRALSLKMETGLYHRNRRREMSVRAITSVKHLRAKSDKLFSDKDSTLV